MFCCCLNAEGLRLPHLSKQVARRARLHCRRQQQLALSTAAASHLGNSSSELPAALRQVLAEALRQLLVAVDL